MTGIWTVDIEVHLLLYYKLVLSPPVFFDVFSCLLMFLVELGISKKKYHDTRQAIRYSITIYNWYRFALSILSKLSFLYNTIFMDVNICYLFINNVLVYCAFAYYTKYKTQ